MPEITPFANESDSVQIDDLTVENRMDRVSVYGSIAFTKDQVGLRRVREMKALIDGIAQALEREHNLPEHLPTVDPDEVANPFG